MQCNNHPHLITSYQLNVIPAMQQVENFAGIHVSYAFRPVARRGARGGAVGGATPPIIPGLNTGILPGRKNQIITCDAGNK
jgi:hypothetical protein